MEHLGEFGESGSEDAKNAVVENVGMSYNERDANEVVEVNRSEK